MLYSDANNFGDVTHRKNAVLMSANRTAPTSLARRIAIVSAPFAGGALATLIAFLLFRGSFPDKVATHFTLGGTADGYSSPGAVVGQYMLVFLVEAAGTAAAGFSPRSALTTTRALCAFSVGLAAATAYFLIAVMWSVSTSDGHSAQLPLLQLPVAVVVGVALGAAAWFISRRQA
ncbi:DUF1648 domain-containing protein [Streptomyces sp. HUAS TT7]|uniref:DUF1648 domain-containing protein n=1 Tax=Streptomyces sp. HUAS TT7 TaxID=3447507 RepID=UPI003F65A1C3